MFYNDYQSLAIIIANGWYNVDLEQVFTTLTIISLVPAGEMTGCAASVVILVVSMLASARPTKVHFLVMW